MKKIQCKLFSHSLGPHIQQIYTGFHMLEKLVESIHITQEVKKINPKSPYMEDPSKAQYLHDPRQTHLLVEMIYDGRKLILYFDTHDAKEIDKTCLENCDIYFKRSFSQQYIAKYYASFTNKIFPLGLNYLVYQDNLDFMMIKRSLIIQRDPIKSKIRGLISEIIHHKKLSYPRLHNLHAPPIYSQQPKVLFMARAYNPYADPKSPKEKIEECIFNNEMRAKCIRILRKELGHQFYGGFILDDFTKKQYNDVLIDNPVHAKKRNYLDLLKQFPICIATTGLHGSIGWKFAEYVAFSKAIVSEKLQYEIPGEFSKNNNYLEFSSPEQCVEQSLKLLADHKLRNNLMSNNFDYYQHYVRPDMLVLNAISTALKK